MSIETKYVGEWFDCESTPPEHAGKVLVVSAYGCETIAIYTPKDNTYTNDRGNEIVWPKWWTEIPERPR